MHTNSTLRLFFVFLLSQRLKLSGSPGIFSTPLLRLADTLHLVWRKTRCCASDFHAEILFTPELLEKKTKIQQQLLLFRPGGDTPWKDVFGYETSFFPKTTFSMLCRRLPRSFGLPGGSRWRAFRFLFLFGRLLGLWNGGSCGGSVLTPFSSSNFAQKWRPLG